MVKPVCHRNSCRPWWEQWEASGLTACRNMAPSGPCEYRTFESTECWLEADEQGKPARRCKTLIKRFRTCPGMPRQEISTKQETYTDTNVNVDTTRGLDVPATESTPVTSSLPADAAATQAPVQADLGEIFEQFMSYALSLQQDLAGAPRKQLYAESEPGRQDQDRIEQEQAPLFSRWFGRRRSDKHRDREQTWEEYENSFLDV
eukprot:jgi/Astpho2/2488/fgenesh1_pg.00048_%23_17_t